MSEAQVELDNGRAAGEEREFWGWVDIRTGRRVSLSSTFTKEQAQRSLAGWVARDQRGGRPDLRETIPFVRVVRLEAGEPVLSSIVDA